jgi:hypothetical protein
MNTKGCRRKFYPNFRYCFRNGQAGQKNTANLMENSLCPEMRFELCSSRILVEKRTLL